MDLRDLLYFSKGERRALTLLLCIIVIAWLTLILTDRPQTISLLPATSDTDSLIAENNGSLQQERKDSLAVPTKSVLEKISTAVLREDPGIPKRKSGNYRSYSQATKFVSGTIIELNTADTTILKGVPGIGSTFSNRIVKYRQLLGGFYSVFQLSEVYGIDEERYQALKVWFSADPQLIHKRSINDLPPDSIYRHPYISSRQAKAILNLRRQKGRLTGWENLRLLEEFTESDIARIDPYISFD